MEIELEVGIERSKSTAGWEWFVGFERPTSSDFGSRDVGVA
jgi:hypothetical protein